MWSPYTTPSATQMYSSGLAQTSVTTDVKSSSNLQSLLEMLHLCLYLSSLILMLSVNGQVELFTHFQLGSEAINTMIVTGTAHQNREHRLKNKLSAIWKRPKLPIRSKNVSVVSAIVSLYKTANIRSKILAIELHEKALESYMSHSWPH